MKPLMKLSALMLVTLLLSGILSACGEPTVTPAPVPTIAPTVVVPTPTQAPLPTTVATATLAPIATTLAATTTMLTPEVVTKTPAVTAITEEVVLSKQEVSELYQQLLKGARNFTSVRIEKTYLTDGKVTGDYYKAIITKLDQTFAVEEKTGSTVNQTILVGGVVYRNEYGEGWQQEISTDWVGLAQGNLSTNLPEAQINNAFGNAGIVKRLPDEQLEGISVGVLLVEKSSTYQPSSQIRIYGYVNRTV